MIAFIWAQDENGLIGKQGTLPWTLPNDLQYFKRTTLNNAVVMGRKTFDSIKQRALPDRLNIVMTTNDQLQHDNIMVVHDKQEVLALEEHYDSTIFIIGGRDIFSLFLQEVDILYVTQLHDVFEGETYFPTIDFSQWQLIKATKGILDDKNTIPHTFQTWIRISTSG